MSQPSTAGFPTPLDFLHCLMYASDRIKKEKCTDKEILKKYNQGMAWEKTPDLRMYPCIHNKKTGKLLPGCEAGTCIITNEKICTDQGQSPYDEMGNPLPKKEVKKPYLEWRTPNKDSTNSGKKGQCVFGNPALMQWCLYPPHRRKTSIDGVTNVPPFDYDPNTGNCTITRPYCDWMGVDWKENNKKPTCFEHEWQKFLEQFIVGKTIFRDLFTGAHEGFKQNPPPQKVRKMFDKKYMSKTKLLGKDFAGEGVNLYLIEWNDKAGYVDPKALGATVGFMPDEVKKVYPNLVKTDKDNVKWLEVSMDQAKQDRYIKRIYLVCLSGMWMLQSISELIKDKQKQKKRGK